MLSSKDGLFDRARGRMVGSDQYLTKPFTKDSLFMAVAAFAKASSWIHSPKERRMSIKKILVIDDSPTERHVLVEILNKGGYDIITAESGEEGIEKARAEQPDLILMDVVMPGLNGYQATRTLTRRRIHQAHPGHRLHLQGTGNRQDLGLRQGAHDYMTKPINGDELLMKIAAL